MVHSKLVNLLKQKKPSIGGWVNLCDPGVIVIMAHAGYDWLLIDNEHHPFTESQIQTMILASKETNITPIVRVRGNDASHIKWVLDTGAGGIMVPMLESVNDVKKAISYSKYPPTGNRGYSPLRATDFLAFKQEYEQTANEEVLLICQIEQVSAVDEIEEIVKLQVDGVWIGQADLSFSMGYKGNMKHPDVQKAVEKVISAANKHNKPWGTTTANQEDFKKRINQGALLLISGSDSGFITSAAYERVQQCRRVMEINENRSKI